MKAIYTDQCMIIIKMGGINCCRHREQLINFDDIACLDSELVEEILQMRKDHEKQISYSSEHKVNGAIFRGNLDSNNRKSGYGELYKLNFAYFGDFLNDRPHGYGILIKEEEEYYRGEFNKGRYHGKGREYSHSHEFEGQYEHGSRQKGTLRTNRLEYQGEFKNNLFDGTGILRLEGGDTYEGTFLAGKYHGKGFIRFSSDNKYEGNFAEGAYDGQGRFVWSNGVTSLCRFQKGQRKQRQLLEHCREKHQADRFQTEGSAKEQRWFEYSSIPKVVRGDGMLFVY